MVRYLSGLCVAGLGLCGGGWLVVAAVAFGGESTGLAGHVNLLTGAVLIAVCCLSLVCWSCAWRRRMRADGVLAGRFLLVSRREARRNRRALNRDVRRANKIAERSARGARRSARRSARAGGGGGVLSAGVGLGGTSAADEPYSVAVSYGAGGNGGTGGNGGNGSGGTGANGAAVDSAAALISQLREMLVPLLAATGSQPALGQETAVADSQLPQRTPYASAFKPRAASVSASVPAQTSPRAQQVTLPQVTLPQVTLPQSTLPQALVPELPMRQVAVPAVADDGLGGSVDCEEAWW